MGFRNMGIYVKEGNNNTGKSMAYKIKQDFILTG
jgi:hypothetical protein